MLLTKKYDKYGNHIAYHFKPSALMWYVVKNRVGKKNIDMSDCKFLVKYDLGIKLISNWKLRYNIGSDKHHLYKKEIGLCRPFDEWWENAKELALAPIKDVLEMVGRAEAAAGNFPFWKEMARTRGVISNEIIETRNIHVDLKDDGKIIELSKDQWNVRREAIMARLRGTDESAEDGMAESSSVEQGSTEGGADPVQE